MVYNASAEKRIYDLIEKSSQESLSEGSVILKQALRALNQEFGASHYGDLPEHDVERFKIRKKFYESIISAYDKLVKNFIGTNYEILLTEKKELESKFSELEKLKNSLQSDFENIEEEKKGLEKKVEKLTYEINQLNKTQQDFKKV